MKLLSLVIVPCLASATHVAKTSKKTDIIQVANCPEGFVRKGGYCVRPEPVPTEDTCPAGAFDNDGICVATETGNVVCPEGKYIGDLLCETIKTTDGDYVCPEGTVREGDECTIGGNMTYCPTGTARVEGDVCESIVPVQFYCPEGLENTGNLCLETDRKPTTEICPSGTELVGGQCVVTVTVQPVCPDTFANEGETCAAFEAPIRHACPEGFYFDHADIACVKVTVVEAVLTCPEGGKLINGQCVTHVPGPTDLYCPIGVLIDGLCRVDTGLNPEEVCPDGYELKHTPKGVICSKTYSYDCSVKKVICADNEIIEKPVTHTKNAAHDGLHGGHGRKLKGLPPHAAIGHEKHGYCRKEEVVIEQTCQETIVAEPHPFCAEGEFDGVRCVVRDVFPAEKKCIGEVTETGECVLTETYGPVYECEDGLVPIDNGANCEVVEIVDAAVECPPETTLFHGECAVFVEKECPAGGCDETIVWQPHEVCPLDYVIVRTGTAVGHHGKYMKSLGKQCTRDIYTPQLTTCPVGFEPRDAETCLQYVEPIRREDEDILKPQFICPVGFADYNGVCMVEGFRTAHVDCPLGYERIEGTLLCAKDVSPIQICPRGTKQVDGECYVNIRVRPYYVDEHVIKVPIAKEKNTHTPVTFKPLPPLTKPAPLVFKPLPKMGKFSLHH